MLGALVESRLRGREQEAYVIARNAVVDLSVCLLRAAAVRSPLSCNIVEASDTGSYPVIGWRRKVAWHDAVFANAFLAHSEDFDDHSVAGVVHSSVCILPPLLMAFAGRECTGATLVCAFTHASEACLTVGEAIGDALYAKGWFNTTLLGVFGSCAAQILSSGRPIAAAVDQAFELARAHAFGTRHVLGTWGKPLAVGKATMLGASLGRLATRMGEVPAIQDRGRPDLFRLAGASWPPSNGLADVLRCRLFDPGLEMKPVPFCLSAYPYVALGRALRQAVPKLSSLATYDLECSPRASINLSFEAPSTKFDGPFSALSAIAFGYLDSGEQTTGPEMLAPCVNELSSKLGRVESCTDWENLPFRAALKWGEGQKIDVGGAESPAVKMRNTVALKGKIRAYLPEASGTAETFQELLETTEPGLNFDEALRALLR